MIHGESCSRLCSGPVSIQLVRAGTAASYDSDGSPRSASAGTEVLHALTSELSAGFDMHRFRKGKMNKEENAEKTSIRGRYGSCDCYHQATLWAACMLVRSKLVGVRQPPLTGRFGIPHASRSTPSNHSPYSGT